MADCDDVTLVLLGSEDEEEDGKTRVEVFLAEIDSVGIKQIAKKFTSTGEMQRQR
jgi:hypothetical protein